MIILDTNIISELMRPKPDPAVLSWINDQNSLVLYITTISVAEISYGISVLDIGSRRDYLEESFQKAMQESFENRVLVFDSPSAQVYGSLMAERKKRGKPLSVLDGQIAAIARVHHASLATRNTADFQDSHLCLINPFSVKN